MGRGSAFSLLSVETLHLTQGSSPSRSLGIKPRPESKPMHLQPVFADLETYGGEVPNQLFQNSQCLPSGSLMTQGDRQRVFDGFRAVFTQ